jgi:DNA polymerase
MPDPKQLTPAQLARQARQHLESLKSAGVEWLPNAPLPPPSARPAESEPATPTRAGQSLIEEAGAATSPDQRRQQLGTLAKTVSGCMRCTELCSTRTQTVFGVGRIDPDICFVGEAPGADEDAQGEPFVGKAGQLLTKIILAMGLQREEVYICNILKCRPPGNRPPQQQEAENCSEYLEKQIELVRPRSICCLGGTAATNLLRTSLSVGKLRGKIHDFKGIPVVVTYHPSYLLVGHRASEQQAQERKKMVWDDMKHLLTKLGRPIPEPKKP